ncbi:glycosyltransferase family 9 protein [Chlamydiota bacterium]
MKKKPLKILLVRTDRIGDVVLTTPVIENVRLWAPDAWISFMCREYTKELILHNPFLNEVMVYDKYKEHKSWQKSIAFAWRLKKKKFDLALIFHATNRVHWLCWSAGIPKRVGWDRKAGFLLTDKVPYQKYMGQKHEMAYTFDIIKKAGIPIRRTRLLLHIPAKIQDAMDCMLGQKQLQRDRFMVIHPGGSVPAQKWPLERYLSLIDQLNKIFFCRIVIVGGPEESELGRFLSKDREHFVLDLVGKLSLIELASLLKKACVMVANDSGPVHMCCGVGTPVVVLFGRKKKGLGPTVFGPIGQNNKIIHHDVGCAECFSDYCQKEFLCLKRISVDEVVSAVKRILEKEYAHS